MQRRGLSLFLAFLFAVLLTGPVMAQGTATAGTPTAEDEPEIDLLEFGAMAVATREFEQSGEDLDFTLLFTTGLAQFEDEDAAADAFPQVADLMLDLGPYDTLEVVELYAELGDDQIFVYGEIESNGYTFNMGMLVVRNGAIFTMAGGLAYETYDDMQDELIELTEFLQEQAEGANPETEEEYLDLMPEPGDLPRADEIDDPYVISKERVRFADES